MEFVNYEEFNKRLRAQLPSLKVDARTRLQGYGASGISGSIKTSSRKKDGTIYKLGMGFERIGVYFEKGASRGHGGAKGSTWVNRFGKLMRTNPASKGKMDTGDRKAKPWAAPAMDAFADRIQDVVTEFYQEAFVKIAKF